MKKILIAMSLASLSVMAFAKLPTLSDDAKSKASQTASKSAWSDKTDAYRLCRSQDKVAAAYFAQARTAGKNVKPASAAPACADPGPYAYTPADQKPLETSEAHSPAGNAISPPSTPKPSGESTPSK